MEEIVDINLDDTGNPMAQKNDKIALVDADTIAFIACLSTEEEIMLLPESFYTKEEWQDIISDPTYDENTSMMYTIDLDQALDKAKVKIQRILDKTGCADVELHFTGKKCFRYEVFTEYKSNRKGKRAPVGLTALKLMLCEEYDGYIHDDIEADDAVVYKRMTYPDKYILVAIDKDVINSIEGTHFNYYESLFHNKEMRWVTTDADTAKTWWAIQALTGDTSDGIIGVYRIGPKKAAKLIKPSMTEAEMWEVIKATYEAAGRTEEEALVNVRLVHMHQLTDKGIVLWTPEHS